MGELLRVFAVVVAVILNREHAFFPSHIQPVAPAAIDARHGYLSRRTRVSGANHQQLQPRFFRRLRAWVVKIECGQQLANASGTSMAYCYPKYVIDTKSRGISQCIESGDRVIQMSTPTEVKCRPLDSGEWKSPVLRDLVGGKRSGFEGGDPSRRPAVRPDQLDRERVLDVLRTV
ncbi:hypothetical protein [Mycolicibacterium peregrinum]|uniref:hypothetical protein n=1 Tax=Mycolicibacterium peregrinum TaxID=43304 RepID=UPI0013F4DC5F|nr:hypothetical protein [Mycolicibacterium peregrinum]